MFILGRMGGQQNIKEALTIIIEQLQDVEKAIEFVERAGDDALWADLIDACVQQPSLVRDLLEHAGKHTVDTVQLIRKITPGMIIEGLSAKIVKTFRDTQVQLRLQEGCTLILKQDVLDLFHRLMSKRSKGLRVTPPHNANQATVYASGKVVWQ